MPRLTLGFDASTQGISAALVDPDAGRVEGRFSLAYDTLPEFGAPRGVLPSTDPAAGEAPPLMWVEALDRLLLRMRDDGVPLAQVRAVSGAAQQHGSVYLAAGFMKALARLNAERSPAAQLAPHLARARAPIWMDASTETECAAIRAALGGDAAAAALTGSAVYPRFTGPQIRRIATREPETYARTTDIALVSSFMASVLLGRRAPIDHGDGSGMNLMDLPRRAWSAEALDATAPDLARRLPPLVHPDTVLGPIAPALAQRYGFSPGTAVVAWSGDNPCSLVGTGLVRAGMAAISLGTSDTYFGPADAFRPPPRGEGHVFCAPDGGLMNLLCFRNGSLAREKIRDAFGLDWSGFEAAIARRPPGNGGALMLPWFAPEIVPRGAHAGVRRLGLAPDDAPANCRAVVEAQMLAMRLHGEALGLAPREIYATGGASHNASILRIMADVHGCPVYRLPSTDSAALGAAVRAAHAVFGTDGEPAAWDALARAVATPAPGSRMDPDPAAAAVYNALLTPYAAFEREALA